VTLTQRQKNKRWYRNHKAENAVRCLAYYHANADRINAKRRAQRIKTPEARMADKLQRVLGITSDQARLLVLDPKARIIKQGESHARR
jgi:hypothetical protein